jgi:hypothetical protein
MRSVSVGEVVAMIPNGADNYGWRIHGRRHVGAPSRCAGQTAQVAAKGDLQTGNEDLGRANRADDVKAEPAFLL